jgi:uncharacterized protein
MRTPHNERVADSERRCILTGAHGARGDLLRLALDDAGQVWPDVRARAPGRGAWIGVDRPQLEVAIAKGKLKGAIARSFRSGAVDVPSDLGSRIDAALQEQALHRLGLEARAGHILLGSDRIGEAARAGKVHLLIHAGDASEDGRRRLDQAWRVGRDREGSGETGIVLPVSREALSAALGRENAVHVGIGDSRAAARVADAINKWVRFSASG